MSTTKHTPGPWVAKRGIAAMTDPGGIAKVGSWSVVSLTPSKKDGGADAHLIAAAPDLLAAAERTIAALRGTTLDAVESAALDDLRAAIAKARGGA